MNRRPPAAMSATYRLQLHQAFDFKDVENLADYFRDLHVSHLYLSPVLEAAPGSLHGYDVTDFARVSSERGGEGGLIALHAALQDHDAPLRLLLDIVPNHMSTHETNPYWMDVLRHGTRSPARGLYDLRFIDKRAGKIRLPVLAHDLASMIAAGALTIAGDGWLVCGDRRFPLAPEAAGHAPAAKDASAQDATFLPALLARQHYELVPTTDARETLCYRRFFHILDLIGVRVEKKSIFKRTHKKIKQLINTMDLVDGVRVDHIDGLHDPGTYLRRLSRLTNRIWVEKILAPGECLPPRWPVMGTTGYEFIGFLNHTLVHPQGFETIKAYWHSHVENRWTDFQDCVHASKAEVLDTMFKPELSRLARLSIRKPQEYANALFFWKALCVAMPAYRDYGKGAKLSDTDREHITQAARTARTLYGDAFAAVEPVFMPRLLRPRTPSEKKAAQEWRQLSGPAMAKGLEDRAHYRYVPLAALNEVGCAPPDKIGPAETTAAFPADPLEWLQDRQAATPGTLNATSTHDTKRSEDVRHRLYVLADRPADWIAHYKHSRALADSLTALTDFPYYFFAQTLAGSWPLDGAIDSAYRERLKAYMRKAAREATIHTSWEVPAEAYETRQNEIIDTLLGAPNFCALTARYAARIAPAGAINSLSALTLKILSAGIPDIYQGMEIWDFSLVDPDNRRPVDYQHRRTLLQTVIAREVKDHPAQFRSWLAEDWKSGAIKLWLTRLCLSLRARYIRHDARITAVPLAGRHSPHAFSYRIGTADEGLFVAVLRYPGLLMPSDTDKLPVPDLDLHIPEGARGPYRYTPRSGTVPLAAAIGPCFAECPVLVAHYAR